MIIIIFRRIHERSTIPVQIKTTGLSNDHSNTFALIWTKIQFFPWFWENIYYVNKVCIWIF